MSCLDHVVPILQELLYAGDLAPGMEAALEHALSLLEGDYSTCKGCGSFGSCWNA